MEKWFQESFPALFVWFKSPLLHELYIGLCKNISEHSQTSPIILQSPKVDLIGSEAVLLSTTRTCSHLTCCSICLCSLDELKKKRQREISFYPKAPSRNRNETFMWGFRWADFVYPCSPTLNELALELSDFIFFYSLVLVVSDIPNKMLNDKQERRNVMKWWANSGAEGLLSLWVLKVHCVAHSVPFKRGIPENMSKIKTEKNTQRLTILFQNSVDTDLTKPWISGADCRASCDLRCITLSCHLALQPIRFWKLRLQK